MFYLCIFIFNIFINFMLLDELCMGCSLATAGVGTGCPEELSKLHDSRAFFVFSSTESDCFWQYSSSLQPTKRDLLPEDEFRIFWKHIFYGRFLSSPTAWPSTTGCCLLCLLVQHLPLLGCLEGLSPEIWGPQIMCVLLSLKMALVPFCFY